MLAMWLLRRTAFFPNFAEGHGDRLLALLPGLCILHELYLKCQYVILIDGSLSWKCIWPCLWLLTARTVFRIFYKTFSWVIILNLALIKFSSCQLNFPQQFYMQNYPSLGGFPKSAVRRGQEPPTDINQWQRGDNKHDILIASKYLLVNVKSVTLRWRNPADTPSLKMEIYITSEMHGRHTPSKWCIERTASLWWCPCPRHTASTSSGETADEPKLGPFPNIGSPPSLNVSRV